MSKPDIRSAFAHAMQLGECPLWDHRQALLYWIDIPGMAVHRLHPDSGQHTQWMMSSEPGCIALHSTGGLIVALRTGLAHLNTETGALQQLTPAPYDSNTTRFNDGRCDAAGRLLTGSIYEPRDHAGASLYCVERGQIRDLGCAVTTSNGVAFSIDSKTLYHADTPAHRITAYDYDLASASIGTARVLHQFPSDKSASNYGGRPDGAAVDAEDAYWCAMFEGGRLLRLSASGEILQEILLPVRCPTMLAFGGDDLRTLYVTTARNNRSAQELADYPLSGHLLTLRVAVPGCAECIYQA